MSEWWTYRLSDFLLFSPDTYYRLFALYNAAVWPLQIAGIAAGLAILALIVRRPPWAGRAIGVLLAICWAWVAWGYFASRYATINWAATYFASAFAFEDAASHRERHSRPQAVLRQGNLAMQESVARPVGLRAIPAAADRSLAGRNWIEIELFGVAPDPTVLATLGVLLAADRIRWELLVIPLLWCLISGATLWAMAAPDALLLPLAASSPSCSHLTEAMAHRLAAETECHPVDRASALSHVPPVPQWRNGRRGRLKICCSQGRACSSQAWGTRTPISAMT